jgi:hypothetical protein
MSVWSVLTVAFVLLMGHTGASHASEVGVVVEGDEGLRAVVAGQLRNWLGEHGHRVADAASGRTPTALLACLQNGDERCAREAFESDGKTEVLLFVDVRRNGGANDVALTGYWLRKGHEARAERRFCERCSETDLRAASDELVRALAVANAATSGRLRLISKPAGAKVTVEGRVVGLTPLDYDLPAGDYDVVIALDGYEGESRRIAVRAGETTRSEIPLGRTGSRGILPIALGITGIAAIATGVVLIAIDEDPSPNAPPQIRDTAPAGVALVAAGGAALVAAAIVWWRRAPQARSTPVAYVSDRSGFIGWFTQF